MPLYEYQCSECENEFSEMMSLEDYSPLRVCPDCNAPSTRKISASQLEILKKNTRLAMERNERAKYEPLRVTREHECNHSSCDHDHEKKKQGSYQQISAGSRPWMLG